MIDFHTHVLPRLDDGARNADVSIRMLQSAKEQGVGTVIATPHYYGKNRSPAQFLQDRDLAYERLLPYLPEGLQIKLGAEVYFSERVPIDGERLRKLSIADTRYILIELPFVAKWGKSLYTRLSEFMTDTDCVPVLAHVDRYNAFVRKPVLLREFIAMGCLAQINAAAFLEKKVRNFAFSMLKHGYVHCLGTDMHDMDKRGCDYQKALETIDGQGMSADLEKLQENMRRMLADERLEISVPKKIFRLFGNYR